MDLTRLEIQLPLFLMRAISTGEIQPSLNCRFDCAHFENLEFPVGKNFRGTRKVVLLGYE